ncbi:MAG TPA: hypothetical protein ENH85_03390 [Candidatus Scalindua sp.]|nr:hypothetical protein [Candidatus Scalindua sp.]
MRIKNWLTISLFLVGLGILITVRLAQTTSYEMEVTSSYSKSFVANVSAYSSSPDETDDSPFISADQNRVFKGLIACPRTFEFGTYFLIQGKLYYCGDRFNKRFELLRNKDNMIHLDIWMETKEEAIEFGRQYLIAMPLRKI